MSRNCRSYYSLTFENIDTICKEIFKESFVIVEQVSNPDLRHIYISKNLLGEEIKKLESKFKILFVSSGYDEDSKRLGKNCEFVIVVTHLDQETPEEMLKTLIKDIREIPDGEVDRYLIIDEIKKIIKEIKS